MFHMKKFTWLVTVLMTALVSGAAQAEDVVDLPLQNATQPFTGSIMTVKLVSAATEVEVDKWKLHENRFVTVTLEMSAAASRCAIPIAVEVSGGQASLESPLNPTDSYYRLVLKEKEGCNSFGEDVITARTQLKYFVGQRGIADQGKPWGAPNWRLKGEATRQLSFDAGMLYGYNQWKLYRLDFTNLDDVKFEFKKQYSYVQGESVAR
jgi:hypothetical protein